ncbi:MAG: flavin reductase family protein [Candidatus Bathyarchaeia archaeon]
MDRSKAGIFEYSKETNELMRDGGLLLVSGGQGKPNAMTIGWGFLGTIWRNPYFLVAVRESRFTHDLLEGSDGFTVCLPGRDMEGALEICGTKSGRDLDKFKELGLKADRSPTIKTPYIEESPIYYECEIKYKHDLEKDKLPESLRYDVYPGGDLHTIYYGEVLGTWAVKDARDKIPR